MKKITKKNVEMAYDSYRGHFGSCRYCDGCI